MELFGVGIGEAGLVLLIALLVVGPERFPQVAREGGRWYRMARRFAADVTADLQGALQELENEVNEQSGDLKAVREIGEEVRAGMRETSSDVRAIGAGVGAAAAASASDPTPASGTAESPTPAPIDTVEDDGLAVIQPPAADPFELVRRSYAQYHEPPPPPPAPVDPDEMSRHATEAFEGFRTAEAATASPGGLSPSLLSGVNPFGGEVAAQVAPVAEPSAEDENTAAEPAPAAPKRTANGTNGATPSTSPATDA